METTYDLVVIGGGPGGYVAAIRAAQYGLRTACIEREKILGGTCLRVGCIPSKALLEATERLHQARTHFAEQGILVGPVRADVAKMQAWKDATVAELGRGIDELFRRSKVARYVGHGRLAASDRVLVETPEGKKEIGAKYVVLASGSKPAALPGVEWDGERVGTSTEALAYAAPPKELVVIGAGAIGLELGSVWHRLGSKVTVLEYLDRILPEMDEEIASHALRIFERQGVAFRLGCRVTGVRREGKRCVVTCEGADPTPADRVLVAVGRTPNTENLGLEAVGVSLDARGRIPVDERFETSVKGVFAIGDLIAGPMLAHKAEEEGAAVAEYLATGYCHVNYDAIPSVVYTAPEAAAVGKTEQELKKAGVRYKKGKFPFVANGRAKVLNDQAGLTKILADAETDRVLGIHILSQRAGDLIAEAAAALEFGASSEDLARTSHAHPTLAETIKEAAMTVRGKAIHL